MNAITRCFYMLIVAALLASCVRVVTRPFRSVKCYDLKVCKQNASYCKYDADKKAYYQEMSRYSCHEAGGTDAFIS